MLGFYDDAEHGDEIPRDDIDECSDPAQLKAWFRSLDDKEISIKADIDARIESGTEKSGWLVRASQALGYTKMGKGSIKRRLRELGHDDGQNHEIQRLLRELALAKAHAAYAKEFVQAAKTVLSPDDISRVATLAAAGLAEREAA